MAEMSVVAGLSFRDMFCHLRGTRSRSWFETWFLLDSMVEGSKEDPGHAGEKQANK